MLTLAVACLAPTPLTSPAQAADEPCEAPPPAVSNLRATAEGSDLRFTWDPAPGATAYSIDARYAKPAGQLPVGPTSDIADTTFTVPATDEWWGISVMVSPRNACGVSWGRFESFPPHVPYPLADLQAFPGRGEIQALWTQDPRDLGYRADMMIRVTTQPGGRYCEVSPVVMRGCKVTGLTPGRRYTVSATTTNRLGTATGPALDKPLLVVTGPTPPRAIDVTAGRTTAAVSWRQPTSDGGRPIVRYVVTVVPGGRTCTTKGLMCQVTGLSSGTPYRFVVVADNGRAKGSPGISSDVRTMSPPAPPPSPPSPEPKPTASLS